MRRPPRRTIRIRSYKRRKPGGTYRVVRVKTKKKSLKERLLGWI